MNQDFTVQKKSKICLKKNSSRGFHLQKNSCTSKERKKNSCKLKTAPRPPRPDHFFNGPSLTSLLYHWPIIASKFYSISFFKPGLLLQQQIALLEGVSEHFSNVYCAILKEMRGREIFNLPG